MDNQYNILVMDSLPWHIQTEIFNFICDKNKIKVCKSDTFIHDITNKYLIDLIYNEKIIHHCNKCINDIHEDSVCKLCYNQYSLNYTFSTIFYIIMSVIAVNIILIILYYIVDLVIKFLFFIMPYFVILFVIEKFYSFINSI
jgi:hypothetical protein